MIRRQRPSGPPPVAGAHFTAAPADFRQVLLSRRRLLIQAAGGSLALLFGLPTAGRGDQPENSVADTNDPWPILDSVAQHLLPSEPESPGAREINALGYLRFVVSDRFIAQQDRDFIVQGARWLDQLAQQQTGQPFTALDEDGREQLLRQTARSAAGENLIATLLTYLFEALLTAPAYGGNPDGIGWRWLQYVPGFPLPGPGTRYPELPL